MHLQGRGTLHTKPVFLEKDQAIGYAETRARLRTGEIRIFDSTGKVERVIAFDDANRRLRWRLGNARGLSCLLTRDKHSKLKRRAPRKHVPSNLFYGKRRSEVPEKRMAAHRKLDQRRDDLCATRNLPP